MVPAYPRVGPLVSVTHGLKISNGKFQEQFERIRPRAVRSGETKPHAAPVHPFAQCLHAGHPARQAAALSVTTSTVTLISLETRHRVGISSPRITTRVSTARTAFT